jgi:hypothetical protein
MARKILALFLALTMLFTMCGIVSVFAADDDSDVTDEAAGVAEDDSSEDSDDGSDSTFDGDPIEIDISSSYKQGATVVVKGTVNDPKITLVNIEIESDDDDVWEKERRVKASEFESGSYSYSLSKASAGATYTVIVTDDDSSYTVKKSFVVTKSSSVTIPDDDDDEGDGSGKVTIWVDGYTERYVDKQTIGLDQLYDSPTVLSVAEYLLEEIADRKYRLSTDGSKIDRIATTATGSTYLRDNGTTNLPKAEWMYFLNGRNYPESMADRKVKSGDEIVIYYGVPGVTGYPKVTISPTGGLSLNDYLEVSVEQQITDPETYEVTSTPIKGAKIYLYKRNSTKASNSGYTTNASGTYKSSKITSSFISSYQGGKLRVAYFTTTSSKTAPQLCSKDFDFVTERTGYTQASIAIEGAYNTILEPYTPSSSAKIQEYDLYNYTTEVLNLSGVKVDYERNSSKNNFTSFSTGTNKYYANENGDISKNSGWYVTVNGEVFGPNDNLKQVDVYTGDEIVYYFGDSSTRYVYYNIDDTLTTGSTVRVYFYYDTDFTEPVSGLTVYFDGSGKQVKYKTDSEGMIKLAAVDYRGTYELQWGEHLNSSDDYLPDFVYRSVELTYTGTSSSTSSGSSTSTTKATTATSSTKATTATKATSSKVDPDDWEDVTEATQKATEAATDWEDTLPTESTTWKQDEVTYPTENELPTQIAGYPDTNIDSWAVSYIIKARDYNLMSGTTYGYFEPLRGITRAEFTTIVTRILGLDTTPSNYNQVFTDVSPSDWCYGQIMAAYSAGYVSGKSAVTFGPTDYITREEMAVLIARIVGADGSASGVGNFADSYNISSWAQSGVAAVNSLGLMTGDQFGQFLPKDNVNRETAAIVSVRLYEYLGK